MTRYIIFNILFLIGSVCADVRLTESEVRQIISELTETNRSSWIEYGTITARHHVRNPDENEVVTLETVRYDGSKFRWEITPGNLYSADRKPAKHKKQSDESQHRIFAWDGQRYTMYFKALKHAMYFDDASQVPVTVNGPLTAGIIPWGNGVFTRQRLSACDISAFRISRDKKQYVAMKINSGGQFSIELLVDCSAGPCTVMVYTLNYPEKSRTVTTYGDFQLVDNMKVPGIIIIEKTGDSGELISEEVWEIIHVSTRIASADPFAVVPDDETLVEFVSEKGRSLFGRYSKKKDLEALHEERVVSDWTRSGRFNNCGLKSAEYVLGQYGIFPDNRKKTHIKNDKSVSLYDVRKYIEDNGLYCRAIRTNIDGLREVSEFQIIIYLPFIKHFVVLDRLETGKVWLIDLSSRKFYYSMDIDEFSSQWYGQVALVAADRKITFGQHVKSYINESAQKQLSGNGAYVCSEIIQSYRIINCPPMASDGRCKDNYYRYEERYGCVYDPNDTGTGCWGEGMLGSIHSECIRDFSYPDQCTSSGNYISRDIRACTN